MNFVQQKQNSLSMNQNIVNQINVDLPPPVPGKRSISDVQREEEIKRKVSNDEFKREESEAEAAKAMLEIVLGSKSSLTLPASQQECLGRELCLRSLATDDSQLTSVQRLFYLMESFGLLFLQLEDHSASFSGFMETMTRQKNAIREVDCYLLFQTCGTKNLYNHDTLP